MAKVKVIMILSAFLMVLWPGSLPQSVPRSAPVHVCGILLLLRPGL
jgi:hypothetical protein